MNSNAKTPNFDNLLLQSLMGRLQIRNPSMNPPLLSPQSLEELLFNNIPSDDDDEEEETLSESSSKTQLAKEESKLEKQIIRTILGGKTESLKPNSGQAVSIGENHVCVGFHEDPDSDYRVWEWHGHVMLFDEENGYTPEYIYGNYFEIVTVKTTMKKTKKEDEEIEKEEKVGNLGLKELIESGGSKNAGRVLRRNMNAGSPRV